MANYSEDATQPECSLENSEQPRLTEHSEVGVAQPDDLPECASESGIRTQNITLQFNFQHTFERGAIE